MGAWGIGTFENDTAADWAYELEEVDDLSVVIESLQAVVDCGEEFLDADPACEALAACEVIAALSGRGCPSSPYAATMLSWVASHPQDVPAEVRELSLQAIDRILTAPSEVLELWEEVDDKTEGYEAWRACVEELRSRVQG